MIPANATYLISCLMIMARALDAASADRQSASGVVNCRRPSHERLGVDP